MFVKILGHQHLLCQRIHSLPVGDAGDTGKFPCGIYTVIQPYLAARSGCRRPCCLLIPFLTTIRACGKLILATNLEWHQLNRLLHRCDHSIGFLSLSSAWKMTFHVITKTIILRIFLLRSPRGEVSHSVQRGRNVSTNNPTLLSIDYDILCAVTTRHRRDTNSWLCIVGKPGWSTFCLSFITWNQLRNAVGCHQFTVVITHCIEVKVDLFSTKSSRSQSWNPGLSKSSNRFNLLSIDDKNLSHIHWMTRASTSGCWKEIRKWNWLFRLACRVILSNTDPWVDWCC